MNLHVQQSVHVLAAQTYCQIAVSGGGTVKSVRHLKTMIPIPFHRVALNVEIIDGNCCSRWKKKKRYFRRYSNRNRATLRGSVRLVYEGQHDIDLPSTRCQTRRDWNVPIRPTSQTSIRVKSYFPFSRPNHHPLWAWNLAMFFYIDLYISPSIFRSDRMLEM